MSAFRVAMLYHPSHHVPDLDEAEAWFERVFGRPSTRLSTLSDRSPPEGWSNDYATFTPIADLLFDSIDPRRYVVAGHHLYEPVDEPRLKGLGWYVEGADELYHSLQDHGFTVLDQMGEVVDGDDAPMAAGARMPLFFTSPEDAGMRHEFLPPIPFPLDHRLAPGWSLESPAADDPLGIVRCARHTIRTDHPDRALRLLVDVLGGTVVREGFDDLLGVDATSVRLADTTIELAARERDRSDGGRPSVGDHDDYWSIAFAVTDLDRAETHLRDQGVRIAARTDDALLTDPSTSLGIAWRFVEPHRLSG